MANTPPYSADNLISYLRHHRTGVSLPRFRGLGEVPSIRGSKPQRWLKRWWKWWKLGSNRRALPLPFHLPVSRLRQITS